MSNNKFEKYEQLVNEFRNKIGRLEDKKQMYAKDYIPRMFNMLYIDYKLDREAARNRVIKDVESIGKWGYWSISEYLPKEAKIPAKIKAGLASVVAKKKVREKIEQEKQMIEQVRQAITITLPHDFSITGEQLQTIVQMVQARKKRIDCRLVEKGKIVILSAPEILVGTGGRRRR